jgi:predicted esterase
VEPGIDVHLIPTVTHGRVLVRAARAAAARGVLVGFHGYMESAAQQMERLAAIPGAAAWTLVAIQGLHRFYRGRSEEVVASWMTRQDRDAAMADNLAYVDASLEEVPHDDSTPIVYAGFSQGVAMAFRAAAGARGSAAGIIAVGGDVPPELLASPGVRFTPILLARGSTDAFLTAARFDADVAALRARGAALTPLTYSGAHEWNDEVSAAAGALLRTAAPAPR